jgi:hypothetical protein
MNDAADAVLVLFVEARVGEGPVILPHGTEVLVFPKPALVRHPYSGRF